MRRAATLGIATCWSFVGHGGYASTEYQPTATPTTRASSKKGHNSAIRYAIFNYPVGRSDLGPLQLIRCALVLRIMARLANPDDIGWTRRDAADTCVARERTAEMACLLNSGENRHAGIGPPDPGNLQIRSHPAARFCLTRIMPGRLKLREADRGFEFKS